MAKYKAYPEYKDSGVEWLGDIPTHWDCTALKRLCSLITGLTPPTQNEDNYADEGYPWVRPEDLNESGFGTHASKYVSDIGWKLLRHIKPNSTLICCIGTIGKCGYVKETVSTNQQITAATFRDCERFNYYLLQAARAQLEELATGNVLKILNSERLGALNVVKVNRKEANTIAEFLDHETAKIDNLIEKQQQLIVLLKEKRQAVISHTVTKGLNPDVPMKNSGVEWLGEVPEHWEVVCIKHLTAVKRGASPRPIDDPKYFDDDGEYSWTRIADVSNSGMYLTETTQRLSKLGASLSVRLDANQLFLSIAGTVGKPCLTTTRACIHDGFVYFPSLRINNKFLYYIFEAGQAYLGLGKMGTQLNLNTDTVGGIRIGLPTDDEIERIVEYIESQKQKYDIIISTANKTIELMQERRTALISAAVTGKIDVRDWVAPDMQDIEEPQEATA